MKHSWTRNIRRLARSRCPFIFLAAQTSTCYLHGVNYEDHITNKSHFRIIITDDMMTYDDKLLSMFYMVHLCTKKTDLCKTYFELHLTLSKMSYYSRKIHKNILALPAIYFYIKSNAISNVYSLFPRQPKNLS